MIVGNSSPILFTKMDSFPQNTSPGFFRSFLIEKTYVYWEWKRYSFYFPLGDLIPKRNEQIMNASMP